MTDVQELAPAPVVALVVDGSLDPSLVGTYLEIEVPASTYLVPFAKCSMRVTGRTARGADVAWEYQDQLSEGHDGESLWFYCEKEVIEALRNGTAVIRYAIASSPPDGTATLPSGSTTFHIGTALGSAPLIGNTEGDVKAHGDVLATGAFAGDAYITTEPSPGIRAGLYYWAYVVSEVDGVETSYPVKLDGQVTQDEADEGLRIPLSRELLDLLPDASTLRIQVSINLTGAPDPFDTADFPEKTYTVVAVQDASWDLEDLDPDGIAPIHVGETLSFPLMDIYFEEARIARESSRISVEQFAHSSPGYYSGVVLYIGGPTGTATDNVVRITFSRTWGMVRFGVTSLDAPMTVTWYTSSGETFSQTIPGGRPTAGHEARCVAPGIRAVVIEPKDGVRLDCFEFHS